MFYNAPPTNMWFNALNLDGSNRTKSYTFNGGAANAGVSPAFPTIPSNTGTPPAQSVTTISPTFKNEYTWHANLQINQQIGRHDSMLLGYVLANGRNLQFLHNINLINPVATLSDGRPIFSSLVSPTTRLDPRFNQVNQLESGANSSYNALLFNYTRTLARGIQLNANYTWSHSISDAPDVNSFEQNIAIEDTTNRKRDRGNSIVNHPQWFNLTAVIEPTFKLENKFVNEAVNHNMLALLTNIGSGDQASILTNGLSLNGDNSVNAVSRPLGVGRDTVRSPSVYQVDSRFTRSFKFKERFSAAVFIEANNLFNHTNVTGLATTQPVTPLTFNATTGLPTNAATAGTPTTTPTVVRSSVLEARIVQWGVTARF